MVTSNYLISLWLVNAWHAQREKVFYDEITCHKRRKKSDIHEGSEVSVVSSSSWSNEYNDP